MSEAMQWKERLLRRLDEIGQSVAATGCGLALLGLGSVGQETERIDAYSDLDFFVIARPGCKRFFLENVDWMSRVAPVDYAFLNTADGYKLLFADGIFCEFAVFEEAELAAIPYTEGRIVWKADEVPDSIRTPARIAPPQPRPVEWLVGEALTNLYVGMGRWRRGEKLSAQRLIQQHAVDRILELAEHLEAPAAGKVDPFAAERRIEQRFPGLARQLPEFVQGYSRVPQSALAILSFLDEHFEVNRALKSRIIDLCIASGQTGA